MDALVFDPRFWLALGVLLVIADILIGMAHFALAVGVACIVLSAILYGQELHWYGAWLGTWRAVALTFAVLAVVSVGLLRLTLRRPGQQDINRY
jgi:membrane protein implicated in regulation of membrane protease activity